MPLSKRKLTATLIVAVLLGAATAISAQIRRIQGTVVDENGTPVADAIIEARGAVLHADIAIFVPGNLEGEPLVADGGWRQGTLQWIRCDKSGRSNGKGIQW